MKEASAPSIANSKSTSKLPATLRSFFAQPVTVLGTLYVISLTCSMAGMEITSWATAFFLILFHLADKFCQNRQLKLHTLGVELPLAVLIIAVLAGLYVNHVSQDAFIAAAGSLRNLLLIYVFAYALKVMGQLNRTIGIFVSCATLVAVYAIWQHFTGIDLWHQTHQALTDGGVYASVGFFGDRLVYGQSFMMIVCIPWAALLLARRRPWWHIALFFLSVAVLLTSLAFTYGRGVWIAVLLTLPIMAFFASRKLFFISLACLAVAGGIVFKTNPVLRARAQSIFMTDSQTVDGRRNIWDMQLEMFKDHPWLGVGYRQNEALADTYAQKLGIKGPVTVHSHSNYIEMLSSTGLIGFASYMLFILAFILMTARLYSMIPTTHYWHRVFALGALGAQLAFHIGGLAQWNFGMAEVQHQFIFWLAVVAYMSERYYVHIVPDDQSI